MNFCCYHECECFGDQTSLFEWWFPVRMGFGWLRCDPLGHYRFWVFFGTFGHFQDKHKFKRIGTIDIPIHLHASTHTPEWLLSMFVCFQFVFIFSRFFGTIPYFTQKNVIIDISIFRENLLAQYQPQEFVGGTTTKLLSHFGARWYTFAAQTSSKHFDAQAVFVLFRNLSSSRQNWTIDFRRTRSTGPYDI